MDSRTLRRKVRYQLKSIAFLTAILLLFPMFLSETPYRALAESGGIKVYCNGILYGSTAYIDTASGVAMVPIGMLESIPGLRLDIRDNQAWFALYGRQLTTTMGSDSYVLDGQQHHWRHGLEPWQYGTAAPGRDLLEALGASVRWEASEPALYITIPVQNPSVPTNVSPAAEPMHLAFIHESQLWLLNVNQPEAQPQPVSTQNVDQIIGWSHDGQWLAYLQRQDKEKYVGDLSLWVVRSDGQQSQCLKEVPVSEGTPEWSPVDNVIAYQTFKSWDDNTFEESLRLAQLDQGRWQDRQLLNTSNRWLGVGLTWFPDGQSLAFSWMRDGKNVATVERMDRQGRSSRIYTQSPDQAGSMEDGIYAREMDGLKLSPDGRYLAYFSGMNAASLNADQMTLQVVDLQNPGTPFTAGSALGYPQWLAWSPDSRQLAFIAGTGRVASCEKGLNLLTIDKGQFQVRDFSQPGMVDARPFWNESGTALYISRGQESEAWEQEGRHFEVPVLGQYICLGQKAEALSFPQADQADYPLSLSPDGKFLAFERLDYCDLGSLYLLNLQDGKPIKILDKLEVNAGYYGNFYPDGVSIYWTQS
ncbi:MAG TPA: hypothetical protein VN426_18345 [Syntrophomonadaceae bacterium]|nr:hypothetical protein [Syntrophomonadaceae bacterium]